MTKKIIGVYKISNKIGPEEKYYIGYSRNIINRWYQHRYDLKRTDTAILIYNIIIINMVLIVLIMKYYTNVKMNLKHRNKNCIIWKILIYEMNYITQLFQIVMVYCITLKMQFKE